MTYRFAVGSKFIIDGIDFEIETEASLKTNIKTLNNIDFEYIRLKMVPNLILDKPDTVKLKSSRFVVVTKQDKFIDFKEVPDNKIYTNVYVSGNCDYNTRSSYKIFCDFVVGDEITEKKLERSYYSRDYTNGFRSPITDLVFNVYYNQEDVNFKSEYTDDYKKLQPLNHLLVHSRK